jgi:hypothetical protein
VFGLGVVCICELLAMKDHAKFIACAQLGEQMIQLTFVNSLFLTISNI